LAWFLHTLCVFRFPPSLTMMHLCITQYTYWTPSVHSLESADPAQWLMSQALLLNVLLHVGLCYGG